MVKSLNVKEQFGKKHGDINDDGIRLSLLAVHITCFQINLQVFNCHLMGPNYFILQRRKYQKVSLILRKYLVSYQTSLYLVLLYFVGEEKEKKEGESDKEPVRYMISLDLLMFSHLLL